MIYFTYNDQPSGVYISQVVDVCKFINKEFQVKIRLVALISIRGYSKNRKKIRSNFPSSIVLPMFPKNKNWRLNGIILKILFLFIGKQNIWSRGIFATNIALNLRMKKWANKVVFDSRGAYKAEFEEYLNKIVDIKDNISDLERRAIHDSDFKLAVSDKLVEYWRNEYGYSGINHVIIPCTLEEKTAKKFPSEKELTILKRSLGFDENDFIFIYSGSTADWQSVYLIDDFMSSQMVKNSAIKLIILSNLNVSELNVYKEYPSRVIQKWVNPEDVMNYLYISDYGILFRETSVTNRVASPTKFAEYLYAGLKVLISNDVGDFSGFIKMNNCGKTINEFGKDYRLNKTNYEERKISHNLAIDNFIKTKFSDKYKSILQVLEIGEK